jgi:hypothetical protein
VPDFSHPRKTTTAHHTLQRTHVGHSCGERGLMACDHHDYHLLLLLRFR